MENSRGCPKKYFSMYTVTKRNNKTFEAFRRTVEREREVHTYKREVCSSHVYVIRSFLRPSVIALVGWLVDTYMHVGYVAVFPIPLQLRGFGLSSIYPRACAYRRETYCTQQHAQLASFFYRRDSSSSGATTT